MRLHSSFSYPTSIKVSTEPSLVRLTLKDNKPNSSSESELSEPLRLIRKATNSINHGDCRISKCLACNMDLKFIPRAD